MDERSPLFAEGMKVLKEAYAALNRNDIPGFVQIFDPQIERVEFPDSPQGGTYLGLPVVIEHVSKARSTWAEGSCEPERFTAVGDRIFVSVFVRVRLKHETGWREGRVTDVYTFRDGKAIQFYSFADERRAFEWARGESSEGN